MPAIHAVVTLEAATGLPEDACVNTWNFANTSPGPPNTSDHNDVFTLLVNFYNSTSGSQTFPVARYLSPALSRVSGKARVTQYDPNGPFYPLLGPPLSDAVFSLHAPTGSPVAAPSEVAACLSFHGATVGVPEHGAGGSRPKATRRGRVYLGPLDTNAFGVDTFNVVRLNGNFRTDVGIAADHLRTESAGKDMNWCVWSRKNSAMYQVTGGWIDDALDTVRSRGQAATLKSIWGSPTLLDAGAPDVLLGQQT